jgi:hypothetical protein
VSAQPFTGHTDRIEKILAADGFRLRRGTCEELNGEIHPTLCIDRTDTPEWNGVWGVVECSEDEAAAELMVLAWRKWDEYQEQFGEREGGDE